MKVVLSAPVTHYVHAAIALKRAGRLEQFFSSLIPQGQFNTLSRILPPHGTRRLRTRILPEDLAGFSKNSMWWSVLAWQALSASRLVKTLRCNLMSNILFDMWTEAKIRPADIFHFVQGSGLWTSRRARKLGAMTLCDVRGLNTDFESKLLREESKKWGAVVGDARHPYATRLQQEILEADRIVVPSQLAKRSYVSAGVESSAISIVPYGVDVHQFTPATATSAKFRVLFVGSVGLAKGIPYLLEAFSHIKSSETELVVVGGIDPSIRNLLSLMSKDVPGVRFAGEVAHDRLPTLFRDASVFVLPSLIDSFGLVCLEAMASGLPVIVTEGVGAKDCVRDRLDGFLLPNCDAKLLADTIVLLRDNPKLRLEMGMNARQQAERFTWDAYQRRLLAVHQDMLSGG